MGRKSTAKSKERRLQRKEEQHRISLAKAAVDKANQLTDPLEPFPVFRNYNKNAITAQLFVKRVSELDESVKQWAFNLTKKNMQSKYEQCTWGWSDSQKLEELTDDSAWYLIAKSVDSVLIGFSHFRFDLEDGVEVLYCYELQLEPGIIRRGLGKFMMQILELIAFKNNMRKVVLTVLKNNQNTTFFKKLNYKVDENSPIDDEEETYPYEILSKVNKRMAPEPPAAPHEKPPTIADHMRCCSGHHHH